MNYWIWNFVHVNRASSDQVEYEYQSDSIAWYNLTVTHTHIPFKSFSKIWQTWLLESLNNSVD